MREGFAHEAVVLMAADGDARAPGAAITLALCGGLEHEPPCPLAPHHTAVERSSDQLRLRVLFACEPIAESTVRSRIDAALRAAVLTGPDGVSTDWRFQSSEPSSVRADEAAHVERLIRS
jgi:hypothetical protein